LCAGRFQQLSVAAARRLLTPARAWDPSQTHPNPSVDRGQHLVTAAAAALPSLTGVTGALFVTAMLDGIGANAVPANLQAEEQGPRDRQPR
jgi:hypothetical protein